MTRWLCHRLRTGVGRGSGKASSFAAEVASEDEKAHPVPGQVIGDDLDPASQRGWVLELRIGPDLCIFSALLSWCNNKHLGRLFRCSGLDSVEILRHTAGPHLGAAGAQKEESRMATGSKKVKFAAGISVIVVCMLYLVVSGFQKTAIYYFTVSELEARETEFVGQRIKLAGKVVPGSIRSIEGQRVIEFEIWEPEEGQKASLSGKRRIRYRGIVPDTFKDEADVVLEGVTGTDGLFSADMLLAKCPSKYEGKSYDEMKEAHGGEGTT